MQKDLFLTAGYDGCIHLHHSLKQQHLLELVPTDRQLQAIHWSPVRPLVFAAASSEYLLHSVRMAVALCTDCVYQAGRSLDR